MKTLILVRHAKSDWAGGAVSDFDRPLNRRGLNDAPLIGSFLKEKGIQPDLLLSSPANRALTTAQLIAEQLNYPAEAIVTNPNLYEFTTDIETLFPIIENTDNNIDTLMLFGHNPTFTYLANYFTNNKFDEIPTCTAVCLRIACNDWQKLCTSPATMDFHISPKMLK